MKTTKTYCYTSMVTNTAEYGRDKITERPDELTCSIILSTFSHKIDAAQTQPWTSHRDWA